MDKEIINDSFDNIFESLEQAMFIDILLLDGTKMGIFKPKEEYQVLGYIDDLSFETKEELKAFLLGLMPSIKEFEILEKETILGVLGYYKEQ